MNQTELVNKLVEVSRDFYQSASENILNGVGIVLVTVENIKDAYEPDTIPPELERALELLSIYFEQLEKATNQYHLALESQKDLTKQNNSQS